MSLTKVKNQFHFNSDSTIACIPISIMAIYHIYQNRLRILNDDDWTQIMTNGTELWCQWRDRYNNGRSQFPSIHDILSMSACKSFIAVFGENPVEYNGLVKDIVTIEEEDQKRNATRGESVGISYNSLESMFSNMTNYVTREKCACCLIIIPSAICISVFCQRLSNNTLQIQFFDSHGTRKSDACEFLIFTNTSKLLDHILIKYNIRSISEMSYKQIKRTEEQVLQNQYGYNALLFIK